MRLTFRILLYTAIGFFALVGLFFTGVFVAMQLGLTNVRGTIDARNQFFFDAFREASTTQPTPPRVEPIDPPASSTPPQHVEAVQIPDTPCIDASLRTCSWEQTPEWAVIKSALQKDSVVLDRVAHETGVEKRMIMAVVFPEQARFFTSNREVFKRWFEPMKLLGSLTQFSLGVSGIKQETARLVEGYAQDAASPFYPGDHAAALIAYPDGVDRDTVLFERLTDEDDHYYSYLYTALFIREIQMQWQRAGFDTTTNPDVIVTLFNLGFDKSLPNASPTAGGAPITLGNTTYSYGTLGGLFYRSDELR